MKINEFREPDDEQYIEEDINSVINQAINGTWEYMTADDFIEEMKQKAAKYALWEAENGRK